MNRVSGSLSLDTTFYTYSGQFGRTKIASYQVMGTHVRVKTSGLFSHALVGVLTDEIPDLYEITVTFSIDSPCSKIEISNSRENEKYVVH